MKFKYLAFSILVICLFVQCKTRQFNTGSSRNGKCFAKCLFIDKVITEIEEFTVYTGNEIEENVKVVPKEIIVKPSSTKWIKKKANNNCLSPDPDDCLVWCLVEEKPIVRTVLVLSDTTQSQNYKIEKIEKEVNRIQGRSFEWREVACEEDITPYVIGEIQNALKLNQYYGGEISNKLDGPTKEALTNFQDNNNLPIGQLDLETLDALGVIIKI